MVAPNAQTFPLQHQLKGSNTSTKSLRNYSRIQSEMQRDGFEVHKENLLSLAPSKNAKHCGAMRMGTPPHGLNVQDKEHDSCYASLRVSGDHNCLVAPGTDDNPSCIATLPSSSATVRPLLPGEEAINAYNHYAGMFPGAYTSESTCTAVSFPHGESEICPSKSLTGERVEVVQFLPDVKSVEDNQEDKRPRCTSIKENPSTELLDNQKYKQGTSYCFDADGSYMSAARDVAIQATIGDMCTFTCASKSNVCAVAKPIPQHSPKGFSADFSSNLSWVSNSNAYSASGLLASGTPPTVDLSNALPTVGLKLFTTSAHAQMPKALFSFSEGAPSLPLSLEHSQQQANNKSQRISIPLHENSCTEADWGRFLALSATSVAKATETASARVLPFQQRFKQLQAFLKQRDEGDQNDCIQALRSLSGAARSGHAVELETRAIRLSLEEGKEIKRMRLLNVLGKMSEQSFDDASGTPQGPRLPAPGAMTAKLTSVP